MNVSLCQKIYIELFLCYIFFLLCGALSGGKEGVLVVWELETEKKQVLPKMESPLLYFIFSSDPTLSSVSQIQSLCSYIYNLPKGK